MFDQLQNKLSPYGQEQVLHFWETLNESERRRLADQIEAVDLARIERLASGPTDAHDWAALARRAKPPRAIRLDGRRNRSSSGDATWGPRVSSDDARARGNAALAAGQVGVLLAAGGQGTRLGFDHPKGIYPIGPISGASLLQIHIEKVRAVAARYGVRVPLYLMTSPATHDETVVFLEDNDCFGQPAEDLFVFCQGTMPAVDAATGKLLLAERGSLFLCPDGHGGTVAALAKSGAVNDARRRGVKQWFYLQVDNPLVPICDPEFLGYHCLSESEMSSIAVAKSTPDEKVGNFVSIDDRMQVIEYIDFPADVAGQREPDGSLRFWAGSIAIHIFDIAFLERMLTHPDALPFHIANKAIPHVDADGNRVEPDEPNALKFERFIFDLLPKANATIVVEAPERDVFAPLKNAPGAARDTAEYVESFLLAQHGRWLEAAGARVADNGAIEISPLFALDERGVKERIEPGQVFYGRQYLVKEEGGRRKEE